MNMEKFRYRFGLIFTGNCLGGGLFVHIRRLLIVQLIAYLHRKLFEHSPYSDHFQDILYYIAFIGNGREDRSDCGRSD